MGNLLGFLKLSLILGGTFYILTGLRDFYLSCRDKGYFAAEGITGEEQMRQITSINQMMREFITEAMENGRKCVEIIKILAMTRYGSYKDPLMMALKDRTTIRAKASTLACLRSAIYQSQKFIRKHIEPRVVLAHECFKEALRLCNSCSRYTLGNINSAQCPVCQYLINTSRKAELKK